MAWFNRLGICTWKISPTKDSTSDVRKIPLWAFMIGMARRSQDSDRSGSMPARGASLRASSAMGTKAVPVSAGALLRGRSVGTFIVPTGPGYRRRGPQERQVPLE